MTRAKTQRPRTRSATTDDRPSRRALSERQATIERAREERHVMLEPRPRLDSEFTDPVEQVEPDDLLDALEDDVEVTELPSVRQLTIAIHESGSYLAAARHAIAAAGHVVAKGRGGADELEQLLAGGTIDVLLVGIPAGEPIIDAALAIPGQRPIVIAATTGTATDVVRKAAEAGADLATVRPYDVTSLAPVLLAASRLADERRLLANAKGSEAVLRARLAQLTAPEPGTLQPFELFQRVLELELKRAKRYAYPIAVALFAVEVPPPPPPAGVRGILRARAGNALIHSIRDIDLATELDHERFLVLLPYTDLTGGSEVARRIIRAVSACDPVVMSGRTFPPRVTGAVSGARPGQPLSFAKLMRDATRALEDARRDGAELAVQP